MEQQAQSELVIQSFTNDPNSNFSDGKFMIAGEVHSTDTFDDQSQLPTHEYYKKRVEELHSSGALDQQAPIGQATQELITATKKDPVSLLNVYTTCTGEPTFQFHEYDLKGRPDNNKFIMVSELDGQLVIGDPQSSKKEAKRACAQRILDKLMEKQRLNCISETGRKIKDPEKHPRPFPVTPSWHKSPGPMNAQQSELAKLRPELYQQQPPDPRMAMFAEDVDFDKKPELVIPNEIRMEFEQHNPIPIDCQDHNKFVQVRAMALSLFLENAFWREVQIDETVQEKLNQAGMWSDKWNVFGFVNKCLMRANSWRQETPVETKEEQGTAEEPQQVAKEKLLSSNTIEYFTFTLPYIPPRYATLALINGDHVYGQISESKPKSRASCALAMAAKVVTLGWSDLEKKPKAKNEQKKRVKGQAVKKRKHASSDEQMEAEDEETTTAPCQFLLTLHPTELLDPRTHFLLATHPQKPPVQLLNNLCSKGALEVQYHAVRATDKFLFSAELQPLGIPGLPREVTGPPFSVWGVPERSKKLAKSAVARAALDALIKNGQIKVDMKAFADFRAAIKRAGLCGGDCAETTIASQNQQTNDAAGAIPAAAEMATVLERNQEQPQQHA